MCVVGRGGGGEVTERREGDDKSGGGGGGATVEREGGQTEREREREREIMQLKQSSFSKTLFSKNRSLGLFRPV